MSPPVTIADDWGQPTPYDDHPPASDETAEELTFRLAAEHAVAVDRAAYQLRIRDEARRKVAREDRVSQARPRPVRLDEFLTRTFDTPSYRIGEVMRTGSRVLLSAQFKAGKTTLVANLIRSLVDGEPFLDRFPVHPGARVALIDNELDEQTLHEWLTDQGIVNTGAVSLISLRGRVSTFDILDDDVRREWAEDLAGHDVIIFDCLRPVLDALGLDENREAGRFLVPFDALLADIEASEAMIVHHMGHTGERSRGDSRLLDWSDSNWKLVRDKDEDDDQLDDPTGSRYFSAFGRDVEVGQAELSFDKQTRRLTLGEQAKNRRQASARRRIVKADEAVLTVVTAHRGINKTKLRTTVREQHDIGRNEDIDNAVERLVEQGLIHRMKAGNTHLHYPAEQTLQAANLPNLPNVPQAQWASRADTCPPPIEGARTDTPPTSTPHTPCQHGMPNGHTPDPFLNGRLSCPQCALEATA